MKPWMSATLPWFLSVSLHAGGLFALATARAHVVDVDEDRAAVWAGNTFEIETLSERALKPEAVAAPPSKAGTSQAKPPPPPQLAQPAEPREQAEPSPQAPVEHPETPPETEHEQLPPESPKAEHRAEPLREPPAPATPAPAPAPPEGASAALPAGDVPEPGPTGSAAPVYGEAGKKPQAVSLAKALTRACPRAAFPDKTWHRLPMGPAGEIEFSIELDQDGRVVRATRKKDPASPPPAHLLRLVQRATQMLKSGVFAMTAGRVEAGVQRFVLSARIDQQAASDSVLAEPEDLRQIGRFVEPTRTRPGKADFTYNSGRHVILTLRMSND